MGPLGFVIGTMVGQLSGAWVYWRVRGTGQEPVRHEAQAATAAGVVAAVVASAVYIVLDVHIWALGEGAPWGVSVFIGVCLGLCQAILFRGRPLRPRPRRSLAE